MKADEAKAIMNRALSSENSTIRSKIDKETRRAAMNGENTATVCIYKEHAANVIVDSLKRDGFKASCKTTYDPRDGETTYIYSVRW